MWGKTKILFRRNSLLWLSRWLQSTRSCGYKTCAFCNDRSLQKEPRLLKFLHDCYFSKLAVQIVEWNLPVVFSEDRIWTLLYVRNFWCGWYSQATITFPFPRTTCGWRWQLQKEDAECGRAPAVRQRQSSCTCQRISVTAFLFMKPSFCRNMEKSVRKCVLVKRILYSCLFTRAHWLHVSAFAETSLPITPRWRTS